MLMTSNSGAKPSSGAAVGSWPSSAAAGACEGSAGVLAGVAGALVTVRGVGPDRPRPHTGQAPLPWVASTFSAMAICCSRVAILAAGANWPPPWPDQVLGENCRPPW